MLAAVQPEIPEGDAWSYEPKWDGFRTLVFRDGAEISLISRGARPMTRYFPELLEPFRDLREDRFVLDGEIIIVGSDGLDFDALQQRLHPAASRVRMLSGRTPAEFVGFDVLAIGDLDLRPQPLSVRRDHLERLLAKVRLPLHLTPYTREAATGRRWLAEFEGAGLDGVIAKSWTQPYLPGKRGWVKIKHERTADCVVIGYRLSKDGTSLGSLLLGLYDAGGDLHYVGHTSSFDAATRRRLLESLQPLREGAEHGKDRGRMPGGPSRWSRGAETEWVGVRPELVCEVAYDKLQSGQRFRHATGFRRWRPDKPPTHCRFDQIESVAKFDVGSIFGG
ncbi:MAG: ATP-dependent DNA ligase [Candidatus Dormibacteraceae bacterium]